MLFDRARFSVAVVCIEYACFESFRLKVGSCHSDCIKSRTFEGRFGFRWLRHARQCFARRLSRASRQASRSASLNAAAPYKMRSYEEKIAPDDSNKLIVRSRSIEEGISFMSSLLNYCETGASKFKSFSDKSTKEPIKVSMKFDVVKMQQALVKIALNSLK